MAWLPIAYVVPQYVDSSGSPYSGAVLKAYQAGTLTNIAFATDNTGGTTVNSIALNAEGQPEVSGNVVIPHINQDYKLALYPDQTSADADSGADWIIDNIDVVESGSPYQVETATDGGTDAFISAINTSAPNTGQVIRRDFQSANTTTTPTLDGVTLKTRDGSALWAGALSGVHTLQYDGTDFLAVDPIYVTAQEEAYSKSEVDSLIATTDPENATDGGTDAYDSETTTSKPGTGKTFLRDFGSANTTASPTLDGTNIVDVDGNAWAGMIEARVHRLYDNGTKYVVLDPGVMGAYTADDSRSSTTHTANNQSIAATSYHTIFDLTGAHDIPAGNIFSTNIGYRLTVDGSVRENQTTVIGGQDASGDVFSMVPIPYTISASSLKLEAYNASGVSRNVGWYVLTRAL